jgi:hypothetical protein
MSEAKAKEMAAAEAALRHKYPQVVAGSIKDVSSKDGKFHMKRSVQIKCAFPGCETLRRVATSDLAQVTLCEEHTRVARLQRRREARAIVAALEPAKVKKVEPVKVKKPAKELVVAE